MHLLKISEIWLVPLAPNSHVDVHGFNTLRNDVTGDVAKHGVCLPIKTHISSRKYKLIFQTPLLLTFCIFVLYVITVYRPQLTQYRLENGFLLEFLYDFCHSRDLVMLVRLQFMHLLSNGTVRRLGQVF